MNFQRVCGKIVGAGRVDLFFGCEVDGAREGFSNNMSGLFGEKFRFHERLRPRGAATWTLSLHASI